MSPLRWVAISTAVLAAACSGASTTSTSPSAPSVVVPPAIFVMGERATVLVSVNPATGVGHVVGPTGYATASKPLAAHPNGVLCTIVNSDTIEAQLAFVNQLTGAATPIGQPMGVKLNIMGMTFSPTGVLYAAGDTAVSSPTFNSLYRIDMGTGQANRIGSLGASEFLMALAFGPDGTLYGQSVSTVYRIDPSTGIAAPMAGISGATMLMGMTFDSNDTFLSANWAQDATLYRVNIRSGAATPLGAIGSAFVHSVASVKR